MVVQDAFLTETARLADVVLPAALWGEKTGTFTNTDRTVHLSEKAVDPPGEARSDLDIWLDYAALMDFLDRDGRPLLGWHDPEGAFEAWKACSRGRVTTRASATTGCGTRAGSSGRAPTRRPAAPSGCTPTAASPPTPRCARTTATTWPPGPSRAPRSTGRGSLPAGPFCGRPTTSRPPRPRRRLPAAAHHRAQPLPLHTRTKTGRTPELQRAAPDAWAELSVADAAALGVADGDRVRVESRRGAIVVAARITGIAPGTVFVPFHYAPRAANELTLTTWDPVSKQPLFKTAAVRVTREG